MTASNSTTYAGLINMPEYKFVLTNGPNQIYNAYATTLDGLMQITVQQSNTVIMIHIVILAIEGVFLVLIAAGYVWYLSKLVTNQR
jgi:membrane protein DedA with SNARE-associated domain